MTPERWQQIERLYAAALAQPAAARAAYLQTAAAGDAALQAEVHRMLAAHAANPSFLDGPLTGLDRLPVEALGTGLLGKTLGPYRILERVGQGGMGTVYRALRDDDTLRQEVALKVIRLGVNSAEAQRRFAAERRILAGLQHPNIARLYTAEVTPDGTPYVVMEFIDGVPVTEYVTAHHLSVSERLHTFLAICEAVQYAHRNLIVHRDLKPGNILVEADGTVKLLDFGIAKVLDPEEDALPVTQTGGHLMTPAYASPEQIRRTALTTASDQYALGVLLYELLTGQRPYDFTGRSPAEIERLVCQTTPTRPSMAHGTPVHRTAAGDLDNIVLKAMAPAPEQRYASVEHLADDIRRHLAGRPVLARPATWTYRATTFVRRNRWGVAAAGAFVLLLLGGSIITAYQAAQIRAQAQAVAHERDTAEAVSGFLTDLFRAADPSDTGGEAVSAQALLDRGTARIESELAGQPAIQADLLLVMSTAYQHLGRYDQALALADRALARLEPGATPEALAPAQYRKAELLRRLGKATEAEVLLNTALAGHRQDPAAEARFEVIILRDLALAIEEQGRYAEAQGYMQDALAHAQTLDPDAPAVRAVIHAGLARILQQQGHLAEAEGHYRAALALKTSALGAHHRDVAATYNDLATLLHDQQKDEAALDMHRRAGAIYEALYGPVHPHLATSLYNQGTMYYALGRYDEASDHILRALDLRRQLLGEAHPRVANTLNYLAAVLHKKGDLEGAAARYRETLAMRRQVQGPDHPYVFYTLSNFAELEYDRGHYAEAEQLYRAAVADFERRLSPTHDRTTKAQLGLGRTLRALNRPAEANAYLEAAHNGRLEAHGPDHALTREALAARNPAE